MSASCLREDEGRENPNTDDTNDFGFLGHIELRVTCDLFQMFTGSTNGPET